MKKETRKINGNDITVIWGKLEHVPSDEFYYPNGRLGRFVKRLVVNGVEIELQETDQYGQLKSYNQESIYHTGDIMSTDLDPVAEAINAGIQSRFRPCALCGKLGEVVLTEVNGWHRLEVSCPDKCDEGGTGEENILASRESLRDLRIWAYSEELLDFESIRRV